VFGFKGQLGNTLEPELEGTTVQAEVNAGNVAATEAEGFDDLRPQDFAGAATGETHTLMTEGIIVPVNSITTDTETLGDNDQTGQFRIVFDVTAFENDFYIADSGVNFRIDGGNGSETINSVLSATADEDTTGVFTVQDGDTETFVLTVEVDPGITSQYRLVLDSIAYSDQTNGVTAVRTQQLFPESDFRTNFQTIQGS